MKTVLILFLFSFPLLAATYECKRRDKKTVSISFLPKETQILEEVKWSLPFFKVFLDEPRQPIRFYTSLPEKNSKATLEKMS